MITKTSPTIALTRIVALGVVLSCLLCRPVLATPAPGVDLPTKPTPQRSSIERNGVRAAQTVSTVTGVAISPLLGVSAIGAYTWWRAPQPQRASLQWYARPWFWIPALLLVGVTIVKDILGTAAPTALKKPFDVAEAIENKISALVVAGAFVPLITTVLESAPGGNDPSSLATLGFAVIDGAAIGNALLVPFAIITFVVVWLAANAINTLILLSPFTTVDAALKLFRGFLLSLVTLTSFANPYVGAAFAAAIILVAFLIAGWSFRLSFFGGVFLWDFCTRRRKRFEPSAQPNWMFTARAVEQAPVRSYGKLLKTPDGALRFRYRPFLIGPVRSFRLAPEHHVVGRGILCSDISRQEGAELEPALLLPPRYRTHEEQLARTHGLAGVRDVGLLRGYRATVGWLKDMVGFRPRVTSPA